jgi:drug/metabolite transporter (DMT)-like permease
MTSRFERQATAALLAATAIWGATFVTVKDALAAADVFTFLALRFGVGMVTAAVLAWILRRGRAFPRQVIKPGLGLGALLYGGYALQTLGLESTTPSRSAFITGLTVLFVPFVSWQLTGKRPPARAFFAPVVALIGLQRLTGASFSGEVPIGDALTLGCAAIYAVHIAGMGKWGAGLPALELTAVQLGVVSLFSVFTFPLVERRFEPTPGFWAAVIFTGVVASAIAIAVQVWAQAQVNATRAAVLFSLEPVFALATAVISGLGWPSASELVGCGFILAAVLISEVELPSLQRMRLQSRGP